MLWSKVLDSSIWINGSKEDRLVWITILAMKDKDGIIQASVVGLADRAKVTPAECRASLKVLLSPDKDDTSGVDQGRRIREIPGGWQVVNHDLYRFSTEAKREFWRQQKEEQRRRDAAKAGAWKRKKRRGPLNGEAETLRKVASGELTQAQADARASTSRERVK